MTKMKQFILLHMINIYVGDFGMSTSQEFLIA